MDHKDRLIKRSCEAESSEGHDEVICQKTDDIQRFPPGALFMCNLCNMCETWLEIRPHPERRRRYRRPYRMPVMPPSVQSRDLQRGATLPASGALKALVCPFCTCRAISIMREARSKLRLIKPEDMDMEEYLVLSNRWPDLCFVGHFSGIYRLCYCA